MLAQKLDMFILLTDELGLESECILESGYDQTQYYGTFSITHNYIAKSIRIKKLILCKLTFTE